MFVPLHYQVSEYDCVPTAMLNAITYLFEREAVPPMVIRHIYSYSRTRLRGLRGHVRVLPDQDRRGPNLAVAREWMDGDDGTRRFGLGALSAREALAVRRDR